jgi:hypothetical protein
MTPGKAADVYKFADGGMGEVGAAHDFGDRNQGLIKTDLRVHDGIVSPSGKTQCQQKDKKICEPLDYKHFSASQMLKPAGGICDDEVRHGFAAT